MPAWSVQRAFVGGGAIGGAGDILFAITFNGINGTPPMQLLQVVASGLLGEAAFDGGAATAALGLGLHFLACLAFAAIYVLASGRIGFLTRRPIVAGALFGIAVFVFMRFVVLPYSAFPFPVHFRPLGTVLDLLSHMFLFGVPIALAARKARQP